jgi:site-specific DNA-cytosine methylase
MDHAAKNVPQTDDQRLAARLLAEIKARKLSVKEAAVQANVSSNTLERHLSGSHIRSDSARKYEDWLQGRTAKRNIFRTNPTRRDRAVETPLAEERAPSPPSSPHLVVDIFSGCGGLSLGFDLLGQGAHFKTVLAMDVQAAPVSVMNKNLPAPSGSPVGIARVTDLAEFIDETEVIAFYMEHVIALHCDHDGLDRLNGLAGGIFPEFLTNLRAIDELFLQELGTARATADYQRSYAKLDKEVLGQTSVLGFQDALKLPRATKGRATLGTVLWRDVYGRHTKPNPTSNKKPIIPDGLLVEAKHAWELQLAALEAKQMSKGKGQLQSAAGRIKAFVDFARSSAFGQVRDAWCRWQAARLSLRSATFQLPDFAKGIRALYEEKYQVSVLLGGPPCQGFSRIGRGKIRSLREAHVQVHGDEAAGDARNLLYQRYLLVLSALRPAIFKFENVEHFQSTVKTEGREFLATDILAEAIDEMSDGEVAYAVSSRTVDASQHGIPQARQRFFMSGARRDLFAGQNPEAIAKGCLMLPVEDQVSLGVAIEGLPEPSLGGGEIRGGTSMAELIAVAPAVPRPILTSEGRLSAWVRQAKPGHNAPPEVTDAHISRAAREDDAELFALFGPGKRWMDYRVDQAESVTSLRNIVQLLLELPPSAIQQINAKLKAGQKKMPSSEELNLLLPMLDGSLALRLLMEQIGHDLEAPHHLAKATYLSKRDGNHGDWFARMDGNRPSKTLTAHMGKDSYGYVHPYQPRTISVREAARVQTFPDWYSFGNVALTDAFKMIGNAVPPLLSYRIAIRVATALASRSLKAKKVLSHAA